VSNAIKLSQLTAQIREAQPWSEGTRLRRTTICGKRRFQIVGDYLGQRICKTLEASNELEAVQAAQDWFTRNRDGVIEGGRYQPTGALRSAEEACIEVILRKVLRSDTEGTQVRSIQACFSWLAAGSHSVGQGSLMAWIRTSDKATRARRQFIETARLVASASDVRLVVPAHEKYVTPRRGRAPERELIGDQDLIDLMRRMQADGLDDAARWQLSIGCFTGLRLNTVFTLRPPADPAAEWCGYDNKREEKVQTGLSLPIDLFEELGLRRVPPKIIEAQMPQLQAASNDQLVKANRRTHLSLLKLRRKYGADMCKRFSARAIRSAVVARLLRLGMAPTEVASLVSTSTRCIDQNYSGFFKSTSFKSLERLRAAK